MRRTALFFLVAFTLVGCHDRSEVTAPFELEPAAVLVTDCATQTAIPQAECQALVALYNATDGPNWTRRAGWLEDDNPCGWEGITCAGTGVSMISLFQNNMTGSLPPEIGNFTSLDWVNLGFNNLSGPLPPEIGNLTSLTRLYLASNINTSHDGGFSGPIPPELGNLDNLIHLYLNNSSFSGPIPPELGDMARLQILHLQGNDLTGPIPVEIGNLSTLEWFDAGNNQLTGPLPELTGLTSIQNFWIPSNPIGGAVPTWITSLPVLKAVRFGNTGMTGVIPPQLGSITNLELLDLSNNSLTGSIPPELGQLSSLYTLSLYGNALEGTIPPELGDLANLGNLSIWDNNLSGPIPATLGQLSNLRSFSASRNDLTGPLPPELGDLGLLENLFLDNNRIDGLIPGRLGNLSALRYLDLSDNQLSGSVPAELGNLLSPPLLFLDLTQNSLTGVLSQEVAELGVDLKAFEPGLGCRMAGNQIELDGAYRYLTNGEPICGLNFPPANEPPEAEAGSDVNATEGSDFTLDASGSTDPDGDPLTYQWYVDGVVLPWATQATLTYQFQDNGSHEVSVIVSDGSLSDSDEAYIYVSNVAPGVTSLTSVTEPVLLGQPVDVDFAFVDPGVLDTHSATIDWGDGNAPATMSLPAGDRAARSSYTYAEPGVYTVTLTVTDDDGGSDTAIFQYVVVYDPVGGSVTGGGQIDSPAGAYLPDPTLSGKGVFGFHSEYKKGASVPDGTAQFNFTVAHMRFSSTSHSWLVVNQGGTNAQFKGRGTINGDTDVNGEEYYFMIWAGDGSTDTFRIKIWWEVMGTETVVYDNGVLQPIGGGQIRIHE